MAAEQILAAALDCLRLAEEALAAPNGNKNLIKYEVVKQVGRAEALRMKASLASNHTLRQCMTVSAFVTYAISKGVLSKITQKNYEKDQIKFWKVFGLVASDVVVDGTKLDAAACDKDSWSRVDSRSTSGSKVILYAAPATIEFILAPGFEAAFIVALKMTGKSVHALSQDADRAAGKEVPVRDRSKEKRYDKEPTKAELKAQLEALKAELAARDARDAERDKKLAAADKKLAAFAATDGYRFMWKVTSVFLCFLKLVVMYTHTIERT